MSHELVQKRRVYSIAPIHLYETVVTDLGLVNLNSTGDKFSIAPAVPIDIYRFGYITAQSQDPDAGGFQLDISLRPTAGSDTNRSATKASIFRADAQVVGAGKVVYRDVIIPVAEATVTGPGGTLNKVNVGPAGPLHVRPGEEAVLAVSNAMGVAATAKLFIEYVEHDFAPVSSVTAADGVNLVKDIT